MCGTSLSGTCPSIRTRTLASTPLVRPRHCTRISPRRRTTAPVGIPYVTVPADRHRHQQPGHRTGQGGQGNSHQQQSRNLGPPAAWGDAGQQDHRTPAAQTGRRHHDPGARPAEDDPDHGPRPDPDHPRIGQGLRNSACIRTPDTARPPPTNSPSKSLGRRMSHKTMPSCRFGPVCNACANRKGESPLAPVPDPASTARTAISGTRLRPVSRWPHKARHAAPVPPARCAGQNPAGTARPSQ